MGRNRTQRYADFLVTDAKTMEAEGHGETKEILREAIEREETEAKGAAVNSIEAKAEELSKDVPMNHEKLLNIAVDRLEAAQSDIREGGYQGD